MKAKEIIFVKIVVKHLALDTNWTIMNEQRIKIGLNFNVKFVRKILHQMVIRTVILKWSTEEKNTTIVIRVTKILGKYVKT